MWWNVVWRLALAALVGAAALVGPGGATAASPSRLQRRFYDGGPGAGAPCATHAGCGPDRFCYTRPAAVAAARGTCLQCWRCCLFPGAYGPCPAGCSCRAGGGCSDPHDCGQGMFCARASGPAPGPATCRSCFACVRDEDAVPGGCGLSCPPGPLGSAADGMRVFMSFSAAEIAHDAAPVPTGRVAVHELSAWLASQTTTTTAPGQAEAGARALMGVGVGVGVGEGGANATVATEALVAALSRRPALSALCPAAGAATTYAGCPCNATARAASLRCAAGLRCSTSAYRGLRTDLVWQPLLELTRALCVACLPGQHCPHGTAVDDATGQGQGQAPAAALDCPTGAYCPTPAAALPCPAGSFCGARAVAPTTCDYAQLLADDPYRVLPGACGGGGGGGDGRGGTVLARLGGGGDPYRGNTCPANSTSPATPCAAGRYCPDAATVLVCPAGHHCKAQSVRPWRCGPLVRCAAGTGAPPRSWLALVLLFGVLAALPLTWLLVRWLDDSSTVRSRHEAMRSEIRRARASTMDRAMIRHFRARQAAVMAAGAGAGAGAGADADADADADAGAYAGFGRVQSRVVLQFERMGMRVACARTRTRTRTRTRVSSDVGGAGGAGGSDDGVVLSCVSGRFASGELHAIMGPSGSGKTSLLSVLRGKHQRGGCVVEGDIVVNGRRADLSVLRGVTGFVPQDDIVHVDLSVRENLAFAAHLKLPRAAYNRRRRQLIVEDALDMLQLRHIQHYRVGSVEHRGVSGGQRKRVSIGLELVGAPSLLFLDEPTSGLDSSASSDVTRCMASMARLGMAVVAVIHQPRFSSFDLFDQVLLLGQGGSTVYAGPPRVALAYFRLALGFALPEHENPADALLDAVSGKLPCGRAPDFAPRRDLARWWRAAAAAHWVDEFVARNRWFVSREQHATPPPQQQQQQQRTAADDDALDPATLHELSEQFDALDAQRSGRIERSQLVELFLRLDRPLTAAEADALMTSGAGEGAGAGAGAGEGEGAGEPTLSRDQLLGMFRAAAPGRARLRRAGVAAAAAAATTMDDAHQHPVTCLRDAASHLDLPASTDLITRAAHSLVAPRRPRAIRDASQPAVGPGPGAWPPQLPHARRTHSAVAVLGDAALASHDERIHGIRHALHERRRSMLLPTHHAPHPAPHPHPPCTPAAAAADWPLSVRRGPGRHAQLWLLTQRAGIKYLRSFWPLRVVDALLLLAAAFIVGYLHGTAWGIADVPGNVVMCMTCLGVLSMVAHLRTFSADRLVVARESGAGVSVAAHFASQNVVDLAWVLVAPAIMLGPYYCLTLPRMPWALCYVAGMCVCWWASGAAYVASAALPAPTVQVSGVFAALILGAFVQGLSPSVASARGTVAEAVMALSYNRWAMEILTVSELEHYQDSQGNAVIALFHGTGLCGMDLRLPSIATDARLAAGGDAVGLLRVVEAWSFADCDRYVAHGFAALCAMGAGFRALALAALFWKLRRSV